MAGGKMSQAEIDALIHNSSGSEDKEKEVSSAPPKGEEVLEAADTNLENGDEGKVESEDEMAARAKEIVDNSEIQKVNSDESRSQNKDGVDLYSSKASKEVEENFNLDNIDIENVIELFGISVKAAINALGTLVDDVVTVSRVSDIKRIDKAEILELTDRPYMAVKVSYIEGLDGFDTLLMNPKDAFVIANMQMGNVNLEEYSDFGGSDFEKSAVSESFNQMMGSSSTAIANRLDIAVDISPPEIFHIDEGVIEAPYVDDDRNNYMYVSYSFKIGDLIDSEIIKIIDADFVQRLNDLMIQKESEEEVETILDISDVMGEDYAEDESQLDVDDLEHIENLMNAEPEEDTHPVNRTAPVKPSHEIASQNQDQRNHPKAFSAEHKIMEDAEAAQYKMPVYDGLAQNTAPPSGISRIQDVDVDVVVELGRTKKKVSDILEISKGSVIELDQLAGEPVNLLVNGKRIARGEMVVIKDYFAFRVISVD